MWIGTLIIEPIKPICDRLLPHCLICAKGILNATSLSSSSKSVVLVHNGLLRLICSGVAKRGNFALASVVLQDLQMIFKRNVFCFPGMFMYIFSNSSLMLEMFFRNCNILHIGHLVFGVSSICCL